jgi:hypothetical protein
MATNINTIRVTLEANAKGLKQQVDSSKKKLQQFQKTTKGVSSGQKRFQENLRNTAGAIAAVQGPLGPVAGRISSIGAIIGRVNPLTLGLLGAFTLAGVAFGKFVSAGAKAESQALKLEAILKATGGAAQQTSSDIENLAQSIGINTLASVQGARDAAGVLLTFKSISGDTFGEVLKLSQDLAAVGFGSINTAALQLGKALEEPEIGLSALRRVGVSFSEQQKEQIKVLSLTGRQAEAQALIIKALKEQVGGAGAGAAGGLAGAFDTLGERITLFFEKAELGQSIVKGLTTVINFLSDALGGFIPETTVFADNIKELKINFNATEKEIKKNKNSIDDLEKTIKKLKGANQRKIADLRVEQEELQKTNVSLKADNEVRKEKIKLLSAEKEAINKASDLADKSIEKITRQTEREVELAQARGKENKFLQLRNKLEDQLRSKLGESEAATEAVNKQLEENKNKLLDLAIANHNAKLAIRERRSEEEADQKTSRDNKREIEDLKATAKQRAVLIALRQEEDRLRQVFADEPNREALVNFELAKRKDIIVENTEAFFEQTKKLKELNQIAEGIGGAFESAGRKITDAFVEGKTASLDFKDILRALLIDIQKTIIQVLILDQVKRAVTDASARFLPSIFGGGKATGGAVQSNQPTLVGERGPELFVPRTAGSIVPSSLTPGALSGGGSVVINQNLNFALGVTSTVRTEIANLLPTIQQSTITAVADAKLRGGKFAKAFGG